MKEPKFPRRKQIRIKEYDYSKEGYYFITICTKDRKQILCKIVNDEKLIAKSVGADGPVRPKEQYINPKIILTPIGKSIKRCWEEIDTIYNNVEIDEFIIMPNHIHGIIKLTGGQSRPPLQKIIQGFKSVTTRECFKYNYNKLWQRNYYEHVIRNEKEYYKILEYIQENPIKWEEDKYYIKERFDD